MATTAKRKPRGWRRCRRQSRSRLERPSVVRAAPQCWRAAAAYCKMRYAFSFPALLLCHAGFCSPGMLPSAPLFGARRCTYAYVRPGLVNLSHFMQGQAQWLNDQGCSCAQDLEAAVVGGGITATTAARCSVWAAAAPAHAGPQIRAPAIFASPQATFRTSDSLCARPQPAIVCPRRVARRRSARCPGTAATGYCMCCWSRGSARGTVPPLAAARPPPPPPAASPASAVAPTPPSPPSPFAVCLQQASSLSRWGPPSRPSRLCCGSLRSGQVAAAACAAAATAAATTPDCQSDCLACTGTFNPPAPCCGGPQMITSIVAFATVAEWTGWSKINYIVRQLRLVSEPALPPVRWPPAEAYATPGTDAAPCLIACPQVFTGVAGLVFSFAFMVLYAAKVKAVSWLSLSSARCTLSVALWGQPSSPARCLGMPCCHPRRRAEQTYRPAVPAP